MVPLRCRGLVNIAPSGRHGAARSADWVCRVRACSCSVEPGLTVQRAPHEVVLLCLTTISACVCLLQRSAVDDVCDLRRAARADALRQLPQAQVRAPPAFPAFLLLSSILCLLLMLPEARFSFCCVCLLRLSGGCCRCMSIWLWFALCRCRLVRVLACLRGFPVRSLLTSVCPCCSLVFRDRLPVRLRLV